MPRKHKSKTLIETRLPDGGWVTLPGTEKMSFHGVPEAEEYVSKRIQSGEIWRIAKVSAEYHIQHELIKR